MSSLSDLLAVQDLDLSADQLSYRRQHLPERQELEDIRRRVGDLRLEMEGVEQARSALAQRQSEAETDLAAVEQRAEQVSRRLYSGEVSATRDLQAMSGELDQLGARRSNLEDAVLGLMEEREPHEDRIRELAGEAAALEGSATEVAKRLAAAEQQIDGELAAVRARRDEAAGAVPDALMSTYEKLRARLGGVGVARLVGNRCDGCHLSLSAVELDRVRHLPEGEVYTCEQCSRILVPV